MTHVVLGEELPRNEMSSVRPSRGQLTKQLRQMVSGAPPSFGYAFTIAVSSCPSSAVFEMIHSPSGDTVGAFTAGSLENLRTVRDFTSSAKMYHCAPSGPRK